MEIMAVIYRQVTDLLVATIKTRRQAGVAEVQKVVELSRASYHPEHIHPHLESVSDTGQQVCHIVSWGRSK
jgi:hypothetical protein